MKQQEPGIVRVGIVSTQPCKFAQILALFAANHYHRAAKNQEYDGLKNTMVTSGYDFHGGLKVGSNSGSNAVKNLKLK